MSETEKQEGQKTVVAFITGLLIGGLLVWVFSSTPESTPVETADETDTEEQADETTTLEGKGGDVSSVSEPEIVRTTPQPVGEGSIKVEDQKAGNSVVLGTLEYPSDKGWVVVRELMDGVPGNVLGAARFGLEEGLVPTEVTLQRGTVVGNSYMVVYYTEDGDGDFNLRVDRQIEGVSTTFKAE